MVLCLGGSPGRAAEREGKAAFLSATPPCGACHTLSDAGANGSIGPNLDELKPTEPRVRRAVTNGVGPMPAYGDTLSSAQIDAIATYVATVTAR